MNANGTAVLLNALNESRQSMKNSLRKMNSLDESEIVQNDTIEFLNVLITGGNDECS